MAHHALKSGNTAATYSAAKPGFENRNALYRRNKPALLVSPCRSHNGAL
jgi:hypothetical protein